MDDVYYGGLLRLTEVAALCMVTKKQASSWYSRRHTNKFPESVASVLVPLNGGPRRSPLFDYQQVLDWYLDYEPNKNRGSKPGNTKSVKHGRYIGQRRTPRPSRAKYPA